MARLPLPPGPGAWTAFISPLCHLRPDSHSCRLRSPPFRRASTLRSALAQQVPVERGHDHRSRSSRDRSRSRERHSSRRRYSPGGSRSPERRGSSYRERDVRSDRFQRYGDGGYGRDGGYAGELVVAMLGWLLRWRRFFWRFSRPWWQMGFPHALALATLAMGREMGTICTPRSSRPRLSVCSPHRRVHPAFLQRRVRPRSPARPRLLLLIWRRSSVRNSGSCSRRSHCHAARLPPQLWTPQARFAAGRAPLPAP